MKNTVNERIKLLRTSLKLNQIEFANALGISPSLISKIEVGDNPSTNTLDKIIEKFAVPHDWLMHGKGELTYEKPSKSEGNIYQDTLYKELRDQIAFLRETVRDLTRGKGGSFRIPLSLTGSQRRSSKRIAA